MLKKIFSFLLISFSINSFSAPLSIDGPERKQLLAMGYEIDKEEAGDLYTIASSGVGKIVFSMNKDRLAVTRFFSRERKLSSTEEHKLLKLINTLNSEYSFQFAVSEASINVTLYHFGSYDAKVFAKMVRLIEQVNTAFDSQPDLLKLVNK